MESGYEFATVPRSVTNKRSKARENGAIKMQNLMHNKRVYRGTTLSRADATKEETNNNNTSPSPHARKKISAWRPGTPPPVDGRAHSHIQTETYLEELCDRVPESHADTQTDTFANVPTPVPFVPTPSGIDACTQIEDGDLFDFDLEVEPILEVLVGKALEFGMLEVQEEDELSDIRRRQELFQHTRNAELTELQRLEAETKRKYLEKQRRIDQEQKRALEQAELEEKIASRAYSRQYISTLHTQVFESLVKSGHFSDPLLTQIKDRFLPAVIANAAKKVEDVRIARKLVDALLANALVRC
uniref:Flagellar radial spoke protein putative n=1 Tax=Albugo laibachii Nc14 TaxID=890382 RepID=F0X0R3_9STRA|nr:flagellar radial spoke protein putative [Albugo laibachii Nc14]|eukprot:CCA27357.1 flagellar radial spoke protein putative [Albugo laibachii Nc14]